MRTPQILSVPIISTSRTQYRLAFIVSTSHTTYLPTHHISPEPYIFYPILTVAVYILSFYPVCIITNPMYPQYTVPIILPGLYNYYPHVPSLHSSYHITYTFAILSFITTYPSFITLYHFIQLALLQFNPCPYRLSSTNNLIHSINSAKVLWL
jgi:hypothetical protein